MAKHIDTDKLIAEIKRLIKVNQELKSSHFTEGIAAGYGDVLSVIASLQQEPEVDLAEEIEKYYYDNFAFISSAHTPTKDIISDIAHHFFERGQRKAAEMYDEIEYNRQRAQEQDGQR